MVGHNVYFVQFMYVYAQALGELPSVSDMLRSHYFYFLPLERATFIGGVRTLLNLPYLVTFGAPDLSTVLPA